MATSAQVERAARSKYRKRAARSAHDGLCIHKRGWGKYCWCACPECEFRYVTLVTDAETSLVVRKQLGKCICMNCPCRKEER